MLNPLRSVLCPVQIDDTGAELLRYAAGVAETEEATLHVLHVYPAPESASGEMQLHEQATEALSKLLDRVDVPDGALQPMVRPGDPVEVIAEAAEELQVDMVFMSPHHRGMLARLVERSVTDRVSRITKIPVLVVPSPE